MHPVRSEPISDPCNWGRRRLGIQSLDGQDNAAVSSVPNINLALQTILPDYLSIDIYIPYPLVMRIMRF
jgi:hypothetical protein